MPSSILRILSRRLGLAVSLSSFGGANEGASAIEETEVLKLLERNRRCFYTRTSLKQPKTDVDSIRSLFPYCWLPFQQWG
jgi:hypothetical protein